jgi:hypothetical protein
VITLVRTHPLDTVVVFFNVSAAAVEATLPSPPMGWTGSDSLPWHLLLDPGAPECGGPGESLPPAQAAGQSVALGPWEFGAYHLAGEPT